MVERKPKLVKKTYSSCTIMHKKSKLVKTQNTSLVVYFYKPFDVNVTGNSLLLLLLLLLSLLLLFYWPQLSPVSLSPWTWQKNKKKERTWPVNRPLALRSHITNAFFKQWIGILLMPKIDRAHKNK